MSAPITLTLPWDCIVPDNAKYGVIRGRMLLTSRYRAAKAEIATRALAAMRSGRKPAFPRDCALSLYVALYPPDRRRRDTLNVAKLIGDSLESVCYADDTQIAHAAFHRFAPERENARAEIVLSPLTESHP